MKVGMIEADAGEDEAKHGLDAFREANLILPRAATAEVRIRRSIGAERRRAADGFEPLRRLGRCLLALMSTP